MLAHVLALQPITAKRYLTTGVHVPTKHKRQFAAYLRARIAAYSALILALEKESAGPQK